MEASEAKPAKRGLKRYALAAAGVAVIVATFAFLLPQVANYADVWDVITTLSWPWILALIAATILNIVTFAPPWMVALPGLGFRSALAVTQASTALANVVPGGIAVGMAGSYAMLAGWGFGATEIGRAVTLTGLWNQFANLFYPIVALFLLTASGESTPLLATAAFVGVAILGVVLGAFVLVLASDRTAIAIGDIAARLANRVLRVVRRGPVDWSGENFDRFRVSAVDLLKRRWHMLTFWALFGSLTVFLLLLVSLRALDVSAAQVSLAEAFAAWAPGAHHRHHPDHARRHRRRRARPDREPGQLRRQRDPRGRGRPRVPLPLPGADADPGADLRPHVAAPPAGVARGPRGRRRLTGAAVAGRRGADPRPPSRGATRRWLPRRRGGGRRPP